MQRSERFIRLTKWLVDQPNVPLSLSDLSERLDAAKSSLSEDIGKIRGVFEVEGEGSIASMQGFSGGVKYTAGVSPRRRKAFFSAMVARLSDPSRVLPGGFLYMSDVLGDPEVLDTAGQLFAGAFREARVNVVVTIETKGIPLAVATARYLHVPVAIARREQRVTEGASLSMHYISGSERRIHTMSLSKRAMPESARAVVVDDFMRAGATAKAVVNLLSEFSAEVVGAAVLMSTSEPARKLVTEYTSLFQLDPIEEGRPISVRVNADWAAPSDDAERGN